MGDNGWNVGARAERGAELNSPAGDLLTHYNKSILARVEQCYVLIRSNSGLVLAHGMSPRAAFCVGVNVIVFAVHVGSL